MEEFPKKMEQLGKDSNGRKVELEESIEVEDSIEE